MKIRTNKRWIEREIYEELGWKLEFEFVGISEEFLLDMNEKTQIFNVIYKSIYNEEISENSFYGKERNWATFNWIDLNELDNILVHPKEIKEIALEKINHVVNDWYYWKKHYANNHRQGWLIVGFKNAKTHEHKKMRYQKPTV